jgi:ribosome-binding protein aMBF1 (putative translation factor)
MQSGGPGIPGPIVPEQERPEIEEVELSIDEVPVEELPRLIATLRKAQGLSQAALGERIGYPAPVVGNIEQGSRKLGLKTLGDIAQALGYEVRIHFHPASRTPDETPEPV